MVFRTRFISDREKYLTEYRSEEWLFVYVSYVVSLKKEDFSPFDFFEEYSRAYRVKVAVFAVISTGVPLPGIFVFENGALTCVASSVEKGAKYRRIYKEVGLCVGDDYKNPLNYAITFGKAEYVFAASEERITREGFRTLCAYRNFNAFSMIFVCKDGFFLIDDSIKSLHEGNTYELRERHFGRGVKSGYRKIRTIE